VAQATRDNLIVVGTLLTIVGAATLFVYMPQAREVKRLRSDVTRQKLHLVDSAQKASTVPALVRQVQGMRNRYSNFDRRLPKKKELGEFLREISGNLGQESLSSPLIEPGSPSRARLFHTLPITLRFQGSYLGLASFLKRLEEMERLTQVHRLSVNGMGETGKTEGPRQVEIEVLMNIYFTES